jgi:hypothetical protein
MSVTLNPEYALLVEAMRPTPAPAADRSGWNRPDWERAIKAAQWHRLEPMLARHLGRHASGAPTGLLAALQERYLANAARNAFVAASLRTALDALTAAGVEAMLLKGAALTATIYDDPAVREMLDVDVLVRPGQLDAANAALAALGYRSPPGSGEEQHSAGWMRANHHHDPALIAGDGLLAIELHHHIAMREERHAFDAAELWERSRPHPRAPAHRLPAPEDLLLHVGFHFTRNRLGGSHARSGSGGALSQLADIAWIVAREPVDWDALGATARAYRLDARVFLALFAAHEVGLALPAAGLAALRPAGFDPRLGRRLVGLRVLRAGRKLPVRSLRWMAAPPREVLVEGWAGDATVKGSLTRAYLRRARAQLPLARAALARPWSVVQDYRLNGQIHALERPQE